MEAAAGALATVAGLALAYSTSPEKSEPTMSGRVEGTVFNVQVESPCIGRTYKDMYHDSETRCAPLGAGSRGRVMMRGTVYGVVDDLITQRIIVHVDHASSPSEFRQVVENGPPPLVRLPLSGQLEFGPIGVPWRHHK